jgi:hypothetical protein
MTKGQSAGKCFRCNGSFPKTEMTRHLKSCSGKKAPAFNTHGWEKLHKAKLFHLLVEGSYDPQYWLHLEAPKDVTLATLDRCLRDIWLECCGHFSAFVIGKQRYSSGPIKDLGEKAMSVKIGDILKPRMRFDHEYDSGSTTYLTLRVVEAREGTAHGKAVLLLARNDPPPIPCGFCGKPAALVCGVCIEDGAKAWVCKRCKPKHDCGEDAFLPVVNSPRVGTCAYGTR